MNNAHTLCRRRIVILSEVGAHDAALRPDELDGIGDGLRVVTEIRG